MNIRALWISDHFILPVMRHAHDYYQLIYCYRGTGEIEIGSSVYTARPGYAYFIRPGMHHSITPCDRMRVSEIKFELASEELEAATAMLPEEMDIDEHVSLRLSIKEIVKEGMSGALFSHEATNASLALFLIRLLREQKIKVENMGLQSYYFNHTPGTESIPRNRDTDFLIVLDYIEKHLAEDITLEDLSEIAHFEKAYLITKFKEIWGLSPMKYVNALRIERAKQLLSTTEKSITDIAYETGFGSIHYFTRYFKDSTGITPSEYRTKNRIR